MNAAFGALKRHVDAAFASVASEIARQSRVELGKDSIAKKQGFRSPVALIQGTTGSSVGPGSIDPAPRRAAPIHPHRVAECRTNAPRTASAVASRYHLTGGAAHACPRIESVA